MAVISTPSETAVHDSYNYPRADLVLVSSE